MATQTDALEIRLTDPHALRVSTAGGTPVLEVDTLTLATKLSGHLILDGLEIGPQQKVFSGSPLEVPVLTVNSDGTTVSLAVSGPSSPNLTLIFSTVLYSFAPASVTLTAGTDPVPQLNYVYIPWDTKVLTVSTTSFPHTGEFIPIAKVIVQTAVTVQAHGALMVIDHGMLVSEGNRGHIAHINEWIHQHHSAWHSGVAPTLTITPQGAAPDWVDFATTAGIAYQIHSATLPPFNTATGTGAHVPNFFGAAYTRVTDLEDLLVDSAGVAMDTRYFNLVVWASVGPNEEDCHLFINLPSGSYVKQGDATDDVSGYTNYAIPDAYRGAAILISRLTLRHQAAAGGTWTSIRETDLRGSIPNVIAGGGTQAITTEFADSTFRLFDETDPTKLLAFQLAGITAGNTRTLTVPDASGTIALTSGLHAAVTLAADADTILTLVGQLIGLDPQAANEVFAGPAAGIPADPAFRALVDADIPAGVMRDAEHLALGAAAPHHTQLHGAADHNVAVLMAGANENLGAYYLDIDDIAVPANPGASIRRLFVNTATGELSVRTNAGATVSLEAALSAHDHTGAADGGVLTNDQHDGYSLYDEIGAPGAPAGNKLRLYAKDVGGLTALAFVDSAGAEKTLQSRTRSVFVPAGSFKDFGGAPLETEVVVANMAVHTWAFDSAAIERIAGQVSLPDDWVSGTVTYYIYWIANAIVGVVRWSIHAQAAAVNEDPISVNDINASFNVTVSGVVRGLNKSASGAHAVAAGDLLRIDVIRDGGHLGDTMAGDAWFLGVRVDYTAFF